MSQKTTKPVARNGHEMLHANTPTWCVHCGDFTDNYPCKPVKNPWWPTSLPTEKVKA